MSSVVYGSFGNTLTAGTAVATTSGTAIDFTGIPSWVKRITVMFNGVSTSGSSNLLVQVGSGSVSSSGYTSAASVGTTSTSSVAGFIATASIVNGSAVYGHVVLTLMGSNTFVGSINVGFNVAALGAIGGGVSPALAGALDRIRITTVNGTDTFDAGSVNIFYE